MSGKPLGDETSTDPLKLLARYRELCTAAAASEMSGLRIPRETRDELSRVEAELQSRLWLAWAETGGAGSARSSPRQKASPSPRIPLPMPMDDDAGRAATRSSPATGGAVVYCDGACIGNPGPGGYGALVRVPGRPERTVSDGKARTTNNEMEMTGALEGLKLAISLGATGITVVSDSEYLVKGMTSWVRGWLRNGWKTRAGEPVKNRALWEELHRLCQGRSVTWTWTRGHAGQPENERCDQLAMVAAEEAARRK